jgi:uncharacterized protein YsxB (DUF464 family)
LLRITFFEDSRHRLSSILAQGHAGWDEAGQDVVCAAISAILQAARLGLEQHARIELEARQAKGTFRLTWPAKARTDPAVKAIVNTAKLAIERICDQYPKHVRCKTSDRLK